MEELQGLDKALMLHILAPLEHPYPSMTEDLRDATVRSLMARGYLIPPEADTSAGFSNLLSLFGELCRAGAVLSQTKFSHDRVEYYTAQEWAFHEQEAQALVATGQLHAKRFYWLNPTHPDVQHAHQHQ